MLTADVLIVGAGPAGMSAAIGAARSGAQALVVDRDPVPGGQLVKQTHRFFGSKRERAGTRGFSIGRAMAEELAGLPNVRLLFGAKAVGLYPDGTLLVEQAGVVVLCRAKRFIFATGAQEKGLLFENNDLPGVYGAGAVQTLMNVHGVAPGQRVLMVGSGNIGLIVSYQLLQAGVDVAAIVEGLPTIGGYLVHAAKVRRAGVPILTGHTVLRANGTDHVTSVVIARVDEHWQPVPGTERELDVDVICLAVGLNPLVDLLWQAGCRMAYAPELGGHVPWHDPYQRTSVPTVFVAGDAGGVEEASSAMVTGHLAGITAAKDLGFLTEAEWAQVVEADRAALSDLRAGPTAGRIRSGLARLAGMEVSG